MLAFFSIFTGGCADQLLLYPSTLPTDAKGATQKFIDGPDGSLEIYIANSRDLQEDRQPDAYVLEFGGNGSRAEHVATPVATRFGDHSVQVWAVNYPGYGQSDGPAALKKIPRAAICAFDYLAQRADGRPIIVAGDSIGTTAALYVASHRPVAGVMVTNPPPLRSLILGEFGWWNLWLLAGPVALAVPSELNSTANAVNISAPGLFLLCRDDTLVKPRYAAMIFDAYNGPKNRVPIANAGHNDWPDDVAPAQVHDGIEWVWKSVFPHADVK